ncbi:MAG TPA: hypothetical protein VGX37_05300, partial [Allosphingosinicella sp.]|nr:hypothetical protein [Allosphingosinicella sp.]
FGIVGTNVANFTLRDSTLSGTHGTNLVLNESSVSFTNLSGTALFEGNNIAGGRADNMRIVNSSGSLTLTIQDSASDQAVFGNNNLNGNDSVFLQTSGSASLGLTIDGVAFNGARGDLLQINAFGNSSQDLVITDNQFHNTHTNIVPAGGGVVLTGGGAGTNIDVDYLIQDNSFQGADGHALSAAYKPVAGTIQGRIEGNVIGVDDGAGGTQGSVTSAGIFINLEKTAGAGSATYAVALVDNEIRDTGLAGIYLGVAKGTATDGATLEVTASGNVVEEMSEFNFAALYAVVGGAGSGDYSKLGLDLSDNVLDNSGATSGSSAVVLDQVSTTSHFYFPGYSGSPSGELNGGTASANLHTFLTGEGNVMTNGGYPSYPGGVDASFVSGLTGDPLILTPWMP